MPDSFLEVSRVTASADGGFTIDVPDGWQQGRGAFGGLGVAYAIRALEALEPERPLRALTAELPGPLLTGPAAIETRLLRRGKGMTTLEATILQGGEAKLRASGLFGVPRVPELAWTLEAPALGDFEAVPAMPRGALPPPFASHFEMRVTGPLPFAGSAEARAEGWIRPRVALPRWGPAEVAALIDAYWPSVFSTFTAPRPMATVTFTLQLTEVAARLDPARPLYYRARTLAGSTGYVSEVRELWTPDGELVALNPQTFVIIA